MHARSLEAPCFCTVLKVPKRAARMLAAAHNVVGSHGLLLSTVVVHNRSLGLIEPTAMAARSIPERLTPVLSIVLCAAGSSNAHHWVAAMPLFQPAPTVVPTKISFASYALGHS